MRSSRNRNTDSSRSCVALQPFQISADFGRALITNLPIFLQCLADNVLKLCREIGIQPQLRCRLLVQDRIEDRSRAVAAKGKHARRHFVQHRAKGEKIGTSVEVLAQRLLRRHVGYGSESAAWTGEVRIIRDRSDCGPVRIRQGTRFR